MAAKSIVNTKKLAIDPLSTLTHLHNLQRDRRIFWRRSLGEYTLAQTSSAAQDEQGVRMLKGKGAHTAPSLITLTSN
jgi:hypothetical protein